MELRYWGHSCFEAVYRGVSVVFDPHDGDSIGLPPPRARGDVVLVSHDHYDHNAHNLASKEGALVITEPVEDRVFTVAGLELRIDSRREPHDRAGGRRRGMVNLYKVSFPNGVTLLHLGDLGAWPGEETLGWMASPRPHALMVPVGGFFTIEPYEAWELVERVRPLYAVPMHYWVRGSMLPLLKVWDFLLAARTGRVEASDGFHICPGGEGKTRVLVFKKWLY